MIGANGHFSKSWDENTHLKSYFKWREISLCNLDAEDRARGHSQHSYSAWHCASLHTRDKSSADDNVHVLTLLSKQLHLCLYKLLRHFLGVASLAFSWLLNVHLQWFCTQRFKLLQSCSSRREENERLLVISKSQMRAHYTCDKNCKD